MPRELMRALALVKRAAAQVNAELGVLPHEQGARRSSPPPTRCSPASTTTEFPLVGLADRLGHADQHEHERGARQPRLASCSAARAARGGSCTRTTTSTAASRRTTCSRRRCTWPPARRSTTRLLPRGRSLRDTLAAQGGGVRRHRQDRPHPPAGRDAADARPGVLRLGRAARSRAARTSRRRCRTSASSRSAAPRSAPG